VYLWCCRRSLWASWRLSRIISFGDNSSRPARARPLTRGHTLCGAVGVGKPSQAIGRVQVERGRPVRLPQRRLPERQLHGPSDVDGDAGNASAEGEGVGRGAAGDSAPSEPSQQSRDLFGTPPRAPAAAPCAPRHRTAASLRALMGGRRTTMAAYAARRRRQCPSGPLRQSAHLGSAWRWNGRLGTALSQDALRQDALRCSLCLFEKRSDRCQFVRRTRHGNCVLDLVRRRRHAEYGQGVCGSSLIFGFFLSAGGAAGKRTARRAVTRRTHRTAVGSERGRGAGGRVRGAQGAELRAV